MTILEIEYEMLTQPKSPNLEGADPRTVDMVRSKLIRDGKVLKAKSEYSESGEELPSSELIVTSLGKRRIQHLKKLLA